MEHAAPLTKSGASSSRAQKRKAIGHLAKPKTLNACQYCREKKIKCSGEEPCTSCIKHGFICQFDAVIKKIKVSESYLKELQDKVKKRSRLQSDPASLDSDDSYEPEASIPIAADVTAPNVKNPLTASDSFFLLDSAGKQRYLGSSSSWSFSWQVRSFLKQVVKDSSVNLIPSSEEETYQIASASARLLHAPNTDIYPSRDYAEHLISTVVFHLGSTYHVFDKEVFMGKLETFYITSAPIPSPHSLWEVQFFLVIAFGKLFLGNGSSAFGPPGAADFLRAMQMRQEFLDMYEDPVLSIEIMCLMTLYLLTADMRNVAYSVIGQAMRIALSLGMNREIPCESLGEIERRKRRRVWWTVYIIDRKMSINIGAPLSIRDEDLDVCLPKSVPEDANSAIWLHARLAILEGQVMNAAFKINSKIDLNFILGVQKVFASMTKLSENFQGNFAINLSNPNGISRPAATLHIMYYQCTIMLTRPIMFSLCQQRLANGLNVEGTDKRASDTVIAIFQTCIGAATTNIKILSILHNQDLLEPFLPFDLQAVFAAAFILMLSQIAYPLLTVDCECVRTAERLLEWMVMKGNAPARSRQKDLVELKNMSSQIKERSQPRQTSADEEENNAATCWLWNALDIGSATREIQPVFDGFDLLGTGDLQADFATGLLDNQWFWADQL